MTLNLDKTEWKRVTMGEVAAASKEKVDPSDGSVERFIAGEHMNTDDLQIHQWGDVGEVDLGPAFHRRFRSGQVLYGSRRTYLRKVAVPEFDGVCANTTFVVETKDEGALAQEFLPFIMTAEPFHAFAISESKGSVNPYVNWSDIERYEFDLPPLDEQKRIANLLWTVERHRLAGVAAASATDRVLGELASQEFVDESRPAVTIDSLIREASVGVVVRPADHYSGAPDAVPALRGVNIVPNGFDLTDLKKFDRTAHETLLKKSILREGDVVIVRVGRPGDAAVVDSVTAGFNCMSLIITRTKVTIQVVDGAPG